MVLSQKEHRPIGEATPAAHKKKPVNTGFSLFNF
jgi:hypothetical protein